MLSILLAATVAVWQWPQLDTALGNARNEGKLVALFMMSGVPNKDQPAEKWIEEALQHETVRQVLDGMIVARLEYASPLLREYEELRVIAKRRTPHVVIVDPAGGVVTEVTAFGDVRVFASTLIALRGQTSAFLTSAQLRTGGKPGEAYFLRDLGLSKAGALREARIAFDFTASIAGKTHDRVLMQRARLGLVALDLDERRIRSAAVANLEDIAKHPEAPDIGANAWILLGHERKARRDPNGAITAYTNAYNLMLPGSGLAESARHYLELMGAEVPGLTAQRRGNVRLIFSREPVIAGDLDVAAVVPEGTARVEYFVDGARLADPTRPPFRARLPLGSVPRVHELKAIARDLAGASLGEDAATINDHPERLSVQIVSPRDESIATRTTIEAAVRAPDGVTIESVDMYWGDKHIATLNAPPYRHDFTLPSKDAFGYLRVVARDSTGATAEDAKLINGASAAEDVRVDAVELYAIVHDSSGHIVDNLTAADFVVKEDGVPVAVTLRSSAIDPISVGLALDTSGSMRPIMMDVAEFASTFLRDSLAAGDRTLVTTFDAEPHLIQPLTDDLQDVSTSLAGAEARGGTAIWDAIVFSLRQLRSATGKRSLLVFTDGADNGSSTTSAGALAVARETGVAVYVVLMGENPLLGSRLHDFETITGATGGALFREPRKNDLPVLFARVRDDTRGEYILSFVSKSTRARSEMRRLSVDVQRPRVRVRAMTGYYSRQ